MKPPNRSTDKSASGAGTGDSRASKLEGKSRLITEETRQRMKEAARLRGQAKSAVLDSKVRATMTSIVEEMAANNGIYPQNGGAISINEVARRAEIDESTLYTKAQSALREDVKEWIRSLKAKEVVGRTRVRKQLAERMEDWKVLYELLETSHRTTELELQQAQADLSAAVRETESLKIDNASLKKMLDISTASKVTTLKSRK